MLSIIISCLGRKDSGGNRSLQEQETLRTQEQEQNRRFQEREKRNRKSKPHRWESATLVTSRWKKVSPPKGGVFCLKGGSWFLCNPSILPVKEMSQLM